MTSPWIARTFHRDFRRRKKKEEKREKEEREKERGERERERKKGKERERKREKERAMTTHHFNTPNMNIIISAMTGTTKEQV